METFNTIINIAHWLLGALMFYNVIYFLVGFFTKSKTFKPAPMTRKFGVVIAARNEEKVIGFLVDSLNEQTYPSENYKIFVVADNCTDDTAKVAREHGAIVYERHCPEKARKGWALEYLFENIEKDYGIQNFDGFVFFDADNVVSKDYIEQLNNAFDTGCDAVIGYRNTKNFDHNCISAHYGIHFMRSSMLLHRPRSKFGFCGHIAGTGYLLSSELLKNGWHYSCLTEDTQATMDFAVDGKRIEYCEAAEFYDEQPYEFKVMARQRIRWAKGRMSCFFSYGYRLIYGIFRHFSKLDAAKNPSGEKPKFLQSIRKNCSCYDMFFYLMPKNMIFLMLSILQLIATVILSFYVVTDGASGTSDYLKPFLALLLSFLGSYVSRIALGVGVVIREWHHIHCSVPKMIWNLITWPLFDFLDGYLCIISLFMRVKWKPIKHDEAISINDIK